MSRGVAGGSDRRASPERGVAPVVGLVLLIGLVAVGAVSVVVIGGGETGQLEEQLSGEQAEITMGQLRDEAGSVVGGEAEGAEFRFPNTDDETVDVVNDSGISVIASGYYYDDSGDRVTGTCTYDAPLGSLRYGTDNGAVLGYEANGIFRLQDGESVVVSPPSLEYRVAEINGKPVRTLDVPVVDITSRAGAGGNRILLSGGNDTAPEAGLCAGGPPLEYFDNATVRIESTDFHDGWYDYATEEFGENNVTLDEGNGTVVVGPVPVGADAGEDAIEDPYDDDWDQDGINDSADNCWTVPNHDQADQDGDGVGDKCETIWAYDNSTGATTYHEVNWVNVTDGSVTGEEIGDLTLEVDYPESGASAEEFEVKRVDPQDVNVTVINGTGTVYDLRTYSVESVTTDSNRNVVEISFRGNHTIQHNDTIRVNYAEVTNPLVNGTYQVDLTLSGPGVSETEDGTLEIVGAEVPTPDDGGVRVYAENNAPGANTTHYVDWEGHYNPGVWTGDQELDKIVVDYNRSVDVSGVDRDDITIEVSPGNSPNDTEVIENVTVSDGNTTLIIDVDTADHGNLNPANDINISYSDAVNPEVTDIYETEVKMEATDAMELDRTGYLVIRERRSVTALARDGDIDNDGIVNPEDICEYTPNEKQYDADRDGDDGDGPNTRDSDEGGNQCDNDNDNDGIPDDEDPTPYWGMEGDENTYVIDISEGDVVLCDSSESPEECKGG